MASRPAAAGAGAAPGRSAPQTDVRKRTVLPSTLQNMRGAGGGGQGGAGQGDLSSDEYLDRQEEELNRRVDVHVDQLVHGMQDLVGLAKFDPLNPPHPSASAHRSLAVELKTQQMLASAHSLLSLAHTLKLLHLFGDEAAVVQAQERASRQLEADIERLKARLDELAGLDDNAAA
ncbi:hypothetical protein JCM8115_000611 [Rhodotorula mucilaginosa]|uniref:Uncharacterized protein n=1 Tax=Rhodotorula mucilaginosa TaxID=5537 RepID=A0A9P6W886_RHOMI|nr:hypothetical protein C6P46_003579 [Rhodotorula mucilaginosa]TKA54481.1 hypothetical protein B0A53_03174 [Rhodotorula sp. CCFEE 5036]